jgi:hypothetical protein
MHFLVYGLRVENGRGLGSKSIGIESGMRLLGPARLTLRRIAQGMCLVKVYEGYTVN